LIHKLERDGGVWFAEGGTNKLVAGMVAISSGWAAWCGWATR
jgi:hypothetical protein